MPIDEIEVIKQKLVDQIKPIGVYLFGSFANGTAHADSDFDFYIIVDDNEKDLHAVATSAAVVWAMQGSFSYSAPLKDDLLVQIQVCDCRRDRACLPGGCHQDWQILAGG